MNCLKNTQLFIPPYIPGMNPIEQIWKEIRKRGFINVFFPSLNDVIDKLCEVMNGLEKKTSQSITGRKWILDVFG
jgi:transposase